MTMIVKRESRIRGSIVSVGLVISMVAAGCSDDTANRSQELRPLPRSATTIRWLDRQAALTPEDWLASRKHPTARSAPPTSMKIKRELDRAARYFGNSPRMIANRAVQLETMLAAKGINEDALDLIADLSTLALLEMKAEGFAARCQQYFTIRIQHKNKEEALAALKRAITKEL